MTQRSLTLRLSRRVSAERLESCDHTTFTARDAHVLLVAFFALFLLLLLAFLAVLLLLLLLLFFLLARPAARTGEAVVLLAVLRQLRLDDGLVVGILAGLLEIRRVHHEQVVIARKDDRLLVRARQTPIARDAALPCSPRRASACPSPFRTRSAASCCADRAPRPRAPPPGRAAPAAAGRPCPTDRLQPRRRPGQPAARSS